MKTVYKKLCLLAMAIFVMAMLTGCSSPKATYEKAQDLLAKGKYAQAAEKFESLGSYEEASTLAMYCKACALCEEGNYSLGIDAFEMLGDYKDCAYRINYYSARSRDDTSVNTTDFESMERAKTIYSKNPLYLDSADRITALDKRIAKAKNTLYDGAQKEADKGLFTSAAATFKRLSGYMDSTNRAKYYAIRADEEALGDTADMSAIQKVADRYTKLGAVQDSVQRAAALEERITAIHDGKYDAAVALKEAGKYSEAITAFTEIKTHKDSEAQIKACETAILDGKYDAAVALMNAGKYADAYEAFVALNGHKDSKGQANAIMLAHPNVKYQAAKVGDYITFGTYEQDNKTNNGKEDIEWQVLAKESNRLLVISRYALDVHSYNAKDAKVTWETCTMRTWLNKDFLNAAFSSAEQAMIPTVTVTADKNPSYSTDPGKATQDKVFLLSIVEAGKYFETYSARRCWPTNYAKARGVYTDSNGQCWWWLRTPGESQSEAAHATRDRGIIVNGGGGAVRPALWIELEP